MYYLSSIKGSVSETSMKRKDPSLDLPVEAKFHNS